MGSLRKLRTISRRQKEKHYEKIKIRNIRLKNRDKKKKQASFRQEIKDALGFSNIISKKIRKVEEIPSIWIDNREEREKQKEELHYKLLQQLIK